MKTTMPDMRDKLFEKYEELKAIHADCGAKYSELSKNYIELEKMYSSLFDTFEDVLTHYEPDEEIRMFYRSVASQHSEAK